MTITPEAGAFNPSPALFRQAVSSAREARLWAVARAEGRVVAGVPNLGQRELDACLITVFFTHAALECEWHWQQVIAEIPRPAQWPAEFDRGLRLVADSRGRADPGRTAETMSDQLQQLSAWRNFFQHGDTRARRRLEREGLTADDLDADYAMTVVAIADGLFTRIATATGGQRVGPSDVMWTGLPPTDQ